MVLINTPSSNEFVHCHAFEFFSIHVGLKVIMTIMLMKILVLPKNQVFRSLLCSAALLAQAN